MGMCQRNRFLGWINSILSLFLFSPLFLSSCYVVKNPPKDEPFVVSLQIKNKTPHSNAQENQLVAKIKEKNDLNPISNSYFGIKILKDPPAFQENKIAISIQHLQSELAYNGYFQSKVAYQMRMRKINKRKTGEEKRVYLTFKVYLGKPYYLNSLIYHIPRPEIMSAFKREVLPEIIIAKNEIFSIERVRDEISKILSTAHNIGFINLGEKHFDFALDTLQVPTKISENVIQVISNSVAKKSRKINVHIYLRVPKEDSAQAFKQYYLQNLYFFPDIQSDEKNSFPSKSEKTFNTINLQDSLKGFQPYQGVYINPSGVYSVMPLVLDKLNIMNPRQLFVKKDYNLTLKQFLQTNIWSLVNFKPYYASDTVIKGRPYGRFDLVANLHKAKPFNANLELGLSLNTTPRTVLFALPNKTLVTGVKGSLTIKNLFRTALQTQIIARAGIETFLNFAPQISILLSEYSIDWLNHLPWLTPIDIFKHRKDIIKKTYFNLSTGLTDRLNFYSLQHLSFTYVWNVGVAKSHFEISLEPIHMSLTKLHKQSAFITEEEHNRSLTYAFNQGLVAGMLLSATKGVYYPNAPYDNSLFKIQIEESGMSWGFPLNYVEQDLYQYIRTEFTFLHYHKFYKSSLVYRFLVGVGISFKESNPTLPFFKQFFVGGPNSMRAWNTTHLGLGSSPLINSLRFQDRYGDIRIETNLEYRFNLFKIDPVRIEGAVFSDIGNIWNRKLVPLEVEGSVFRFRNLYTDLAMAGGFGIRFAVSFLIFRLDTALRLKDPIYAPGKQWINTNNLNLKNIQLQIGLGYPF